MNKPRYNRSDRRKRKKQVRNLSAELKRKGYFEDCNFRPCRIDKLYDYRSSDNVERMLAADVDGYDLIDNRPGMSCSLAHCCPKPLTKQEAEERAVYWCKEGERAYLLRYIYDTKNTDLMKEVADYFADQDKRAAGIPVLDCKLHETGTATAVS